MRIRFDLYNDLLIFLVFAITVVFDMPVIAKEIPLETPPADSTHLEGSEDREIPCGILVVYHSRMRYLLGEGGELMVQPRDMVPREDTVWLTTMNGGNDLVMVLEDVCETLGKVDENGQIHWASKYNTLENRPSSLNPPKLKSRSSAAFLANEMKTIRKRGAAKCFRLRSGELYVLSEETPRWDFLYYIQIKDKVVVAKKGTAREKNDYLFKIDLKQESANGDSPETEDSKWRILDESGEPVLPPKGTIISECGVTPPMTKRDYGFEKITEIVSE